MKGRIKVIVLLLLSVIASQPLDAQDLRAGGALREKLDAARSLYFNGAFPAAEQAFSALAVEAGNCDYLIRSEIEAFRVLCNISMDRVNAEWSLKVFADKYPNAPEMPMLRFRLAARFFDSCEYDKASSLFASIRESDLYSAWRTEFRFKKAFCQMRANNTKDAAAGFQSVIDAPLSIYLFPSIYYLAYVKYLDRDFAGAVPLFEKASSDSRYRLMSKYYTVESKFLLDDFDYVISNAPALYDNLPEDLKVNVARILSESFYRKGDSKQAAAYLDKVRRSAAGYSRKDQYFSGYLYYGMGLYDKALEDFSKVPGVADSLSQNAWYRMADCHLKKGNRNAALTAFKNASEIEADPAVREDAFFNYARLSFELNSDFSKFEAYSRTFPESGKEDVINSYMAASYILSKDYSSAIGALQRISVPTRESVSNLQKASYLKAMQFIADGSYGRAIPMLDLSIANGKYNRFLVGEAQFWKAECLYRTHSYGEAEKILNAILADSSFKGSEHRQDAIFNLAYCQYQAQEYTDAALNFKKYLSSATNPKYARDAHLRLGDSYYCAGEYVRAAEAYDEARSKFPANDMYPSFRSAMSYGLVGNTDKKIEILSQVRAGKKRNGLYSRSLLELGRTFEMTGRSREASDCFEDILTLRGDSTCFSAALLEMAMLYQNASDNDRALRYYKRIVEDCPLSEELSPAISGIENIYQANNRPDDFLTYLDGVGMSGVRDDSQKEKLLFNSAASLYRQGRYGRAVSALQNYIAQHPDSQNTTEAMYMLGESLRETGRKESALETYLKAMHRGGDRAICEAATLAYAKLSFSMEHYSLSADAYGSLLQMGGSDNMLSTAYLGRMRSYYNNRQWDEALADGKVLLSRTGMSGQILRETQYLMAKCLIVKGMREQAAEFLAALAADCSDAFGAEAAYLTIYDAYNNGEFGKAEELVYLFSDSGTDQLYWLAKSYLVLGDSFAAIGEREKAVLQYQGLLDSYTQDNDGIKAAAKERLSKIEGGAR